MGRGMTVPGSQGFQIKDDDWWDQVGNDPFLLTRCKGLEDAATLTPRFRHSVIRLRGRYKLKQRHRISLNCQPSPLANLPVLDAVSCCPSSLLPNAMTTATTLATATAATIDLSAASPAVSFHSPTFPPRCLLVLMSVPVCLSFRRCSLRIKSGSGRGRGRGCVGGKTSRARVCHCRLFQSPRAHALERHVPLFHPPAVAYLRVSDHRGSQACVGSYT